LGAARAAAIRGKPSGPVDDQAAELAKKWGTAPPRAWKIGEYRVPTWDSTESADVGRLWPGAAPKVGDDMGSDGPAETKNHGRRPGPGRTKLVSRPGSDPGRRAPPTERAANVAASTFVARCYCPRLF
jgi:hypothetical protein